MLNNLIDSITLLAHKTNQNLPLLGIILLILWAVLLLTHLTGNRLLCLGIYPRRWFGLPGILFAPFLHANAAHLFFNSIPLIVLSDFLLMQGLHAYLQITAEIMLVSGMLIWCFAKQGLHIGASAVITGYWAFLVCNMYNEGTTTAILLGAISVYYFIGILYGIFPAQKGVSWQGHLYGLLAGILVGDHQILRQGLRSITGH